MLGNRTKMIGSSCILLTSVTSVDITFHCANVRSPAANAVRIRMRVNAIRARASASVLNELSWRVKRYERGEGGGVT